jgi:hypothetical protein
MAIFLSFLFFHVIYEIVILLHAMQSISILRHGCMSASVIISKYLLALIIHKQIINSFYFLEKFIIDNTVFSH